MLTKNGGVLLPVPGTRARTVGGTVRVRRLLVQVLFIAPLFWFLELLQNQFYRVVLHEYGWRYQHHKGPWFSFESLLLWAVTITAFSLLDDLAFEPRRLALGLRMVLAGVIGWCGEWASGAFFDHVFGHPMQIWRDSSLVYVAPSALPFWILDFAVFYGLVRLLRRAPEL